MSRIDNSNFSFNKLVEPSYVIGKFVENEEELKQVEKVVSSNKMLFISSNQRPISWRTAVKRVGVDEFISGISRAAFHSTAQRGEGANSVYFEYCWRR